ncbi:MAG: alpha/beta fold hydrolase [Proteobacteria bacterium]|nr:alpha/beta fold hydrolase [Pseudomonadota bacterium]
MAPLLLLPGLSGTPELWDEVRAALPAGIACTALENPPLDDMDAIADALLAIAPPRFALAGFSFGGYVALAIAARAGDRIERLALLSTGANADSAEAAANRGKFIELANSGGYSSIDGKLTRFLLHRDRQEDAAIAAKRARMSQAYGVERYVAHQRACMARPARDAALASIRVPTLVAVGREDRITPLAQHEEMARRIPAADLVVFERCGHLVPLEAPLPLAGALTKWMTQ